jgi:TRAP-type mannitol/chloroaromatic compound transport system substrate-binding protein
MDRREFLLTAGAAAAATTTIAAPALSSNVKHLRLAVAGHADQARRLARRIATMSGGRIKITVMPGIANGLNAVRAGDADLYHASEHDHLDAHRALAYFAGLPGDQGIAPEHLGAWMRAGGGQDLWDELAAGFGVKAMHAGHGGRSVFVAGRRVERLRDLAGEKVSVTGLARDVVRGFGLEPVAVDAARLPDLFKRGEILAAERGAAIKTEALGLQAPFSVGTAINRQGEALSLGLERTLWESLSESDRAIFVAAAACETQLALAVETAHRRQLRAEPRPESVWPVAQEFERAIGRVSDAVVAHVAASDTYAARINASYIAFRRLALGDERGASA